MTAQSKYTEARAALLLNQPFFASLMLDMMDVRMGEYPEIFPPGAPQTMATNGKTIWIKDTFVENSTINESVFGLCHEIGHAMWKHMSRGKLYQDMGFEGKPFNPLIWNFAGDYIINDMLVKAEIGKMPKGCLLDSKYQYTMLVDDVYRKLLEENECPQCGGTGQDGDGGGSGDQQSQSGGGNSEGGDEGNCDGGDGTGGNKPCNRCGGTGVAGKNGDVFDTHILELPENEPSEAQWKRAVQSAKDAAKSMGSMPAHLERFVNSLLESKVPWEDKLKKAMSSRIGRDTTNWNRPHRRRYITQGVVMPTYKGFGAGHIIFAIDTSGSMSEKELKQALGECDKILADCNPERVTIIGCDARVETVIEMYDGDRLADNIPRIGGGGGTSFIPPFEWVKENCDKTPDCLIYFTDTGGTFPSEEPPYPTIWCCSEDWIKPPFGEIIPAEVFNG